MNHWKRRNSTGSVRFTNMVMAEEEVDLPCKFAVGSIVDNAFFCVKHETGDFDWKSRSVVSYCDKVYTLSLNPAYSVPLDRYVFTVVSEDGTS